MNSFMGFTGFVQIDDGIKTVRATSCNIKASQAIHRPDVADGGTDKIVYGLGPVEVAGEISFPAICDTLGANNSAMSSLWGKAISRGAKGVFGKQAFPITVQYTNGVTMKYINCVVDSYEWSVVQSDVVNIKVNIIGEKRDSNPVALKMPIYFGKNSKIITWDMTSVFVGEAGSDIVRSFSCTVSNNVKKIYSLDGSLEPVMIVPTTRDITGRVSVIGRSRDISDTAENNRYQCAAKQTVSFGVGNWGITFGGMCIFEFEEIAITNDLFETSVNYSVISGESFTGASSTYGG